MSNQVYSNATTFYPLPDGTATTATAQILTNKTIDSAANTITITSSPLVATNINSLINQNVSNNAAPSFANITVGNAAVDSMNIYNALTVVPMSTILGEYTTALVSTGLTANDLVTLTGTQTLTNKTLTPLQADGTSHSLLSGFLSSTYWNPTTTSTSPSIATIIPIATNSAIILNTTAHALCSAGPDVNKLYTINLITGAKNIAGTVSTYAISSLVGSDLGFAPSIQHLVSSTNINVTVTGLTGDTIAFSGVTTTYY